MQWSFVIGRPVDHWQQVRAMPAHQSLNVTVTKQQRKLHSHNPLGLAPFQVSKGHVPVPVCHGSVVRLCMCASLITRTSWHTGILEWSVWTQRSQEWSAWPQQSDDSDYPASSHPLAVNNIFQWICNLERRKENTPHLSSTKCQAKAFGAPRTPSVHVV